MGSPHQPHGLKKCNLVSEKVLLCLVAWSLSMCLCQAAVTGNALLHVRSKGSESTTDELSLCILYNNDHQSLPSSLEKATYRPLVNLSQVLGCSAEDFNNPPAPLEDSTIAVSRGNCSFVQKASMVETAGGSAALVVDVWNSTEPTVPGGNSSEFASFNISLAVIGYYDFRTIANLQAPVEVAMYAPQPAVWDKSMILIVIFSTAFVMVGAGWAAYDESRSLKGSRRTPSSSQDQDGSTNNRGTGSTKNDVPLTVVGVFIWLIIMCGMILLLYFFYDTMIYAFIAIFCIIGAYSLYQCLLPAWTHIMPFNYDIPLNRLPCIKSKVKLRSFLLLMPCLTLSIFWAVERHAKFAWTLQDLLGCSFCIFFIQSFRLPNLKVIGVLLILLLIYDVFFVFITPLFTKNGNSIMESIATGGKHHSTESLPMLFLIPIMGDSPARKCLGRDFALLGFGDVIIPGLLVSYNAVFDVKTGTKLLYFLSSSFGYLMGMIACMISLIYMNSGQPALLFLVPGTLFTTVVVSLVRKEFRKLFLGKHLQQKSEDLESPRVEETDDGDNNDNNAETGDDEEQRNLIN